MLLTIDMSSPAEIEAALTLLQFGPKSTTVDTPQPPSVEPRVPAEAVHESAPPFEDLRRKASEVIMVNRVGVKKLLTDFHVERLSDLPVENHAVFYQQLCDLEVSR